MQRHVREPYERAVLESAVMLFGLASIDALVSPPPAFRLLYVAPVWIAARSHGTRAGLILVGLATLVLTILDIQQGRAEGMVGVANLALYGLILMLLMLNIARVEHGIQAYARMAAIDPLTGVYNRLALQEAGANLISSCRKAGRPLVLAVIDCDKFKELNDLFGHASGDAVLVALARTLRRSVRSPGVVARTGGDEFVAILPGLHLDEAAHVMERVAVAFREQTSYLGLECSFSYGLARLEIHGQDLASLLAAADRRMYLAKSAATDWADVAVGA
ncbi:MAG: GGDEF domain-containing protein [Fimbriimonadaceae bacterium]